MGQLKPPPLTALEAKITALSPRMRPPSDADTLRPDTVLAWTTDLA